MPILNYRTEIKTSRTLSEIQEKLARAGAQGIQINYADGQPVAMRFGLLVQGRAMVFLLPARHQGVLKAMENDPQVARRLVTREHALRVSWRIIKDWIEAQLALIEAGLAELAEVFFPYVETAAGASLYETFKQEGFPLLPPPA